MNQKNLSLRFRNLGGSLLKTLKEFAPELALVMSYCIAFPLFEKNNLLMMFFIPITVCCLLLRQWILASEGKRTKIILNLVELLFIAAAVVCLVVRKEGLMEHYTTFAVLNLAVSPLLYLLGRPQLWKGKGRRDNMSFIGLMVNSFAGLMLSYAIACVLLLLGALLFFSTISLFSLDCPTWLSETLTLVCLMFVPLWLWMDREKRPYERPTIEGFWEVVLNYLLKPAVLLYTVLLYCYAARIVFLWELPQTSVASMVFGYAIIALVVRNLQQYQTKPLLRGLFDHIAWLVLPTLLLFWVGVAKRIGDYGVTPDRYYLVFCGALMTLYTLLSIPQLHRRGVDFGFFALMLVGFLATICIPSIDARHASAKSQIAIIRENAKKAGMLTEEGFIDLDHKGSPSDTLNMEEHWRITDAIYYLEINDKEVLQEELHLLDREQYWGLVPDVSPEVAREDLDWADGFSYFQITNDERDGEAYPCNGYRYVINPLFDIPDQKTFNYPGGKYQYDEQKIFDSQLKRFNIEKEKITQQWMEDHKEELLRYEDDQAVIYFSRLGINLSYGKYKDFYFGIDIIFIK